MMYSQSKFPIRDELQKVHAAQHQALLRNGDWLSSEERNWIIQFFRKTLGYNGPTPTLLTRSSAQKKAIIAIVGTLVAGGKFIEKSLFIDALEVGISEEEYAEIVSLVSRLINFYYFGLAVGIPFEPYPVYKSKEAEKSKLKELKNEGAWLRTLPFDTDEGRLVYKNLQAPFIFRAVSQAPKEAISIIELANVQYLPAMQMQNLNFAYSDKFPRPFIELVAGRTSSINECFY